MKSRKASLSASEDLNAVEDLIEETRRLFHQLRITSETVYGESASSAVRRYILKELQKTGPMTVPQMARNRAVTRQHIQMVINPMVDEGIVKVTDNPLHRRSPLFSLTKAGEAEIRQIARRERNIYRELTDNVNPGGVRRATNVMRNVRDFFERLGESP